MINTTWVDEPWGLGAEGGSGKKEESGQQGVAGYWEDTGQCGEEMGRTSDRQRMLQSMVEPKRVQYPRMDHWHWGNLRAAGRMDRGERGETGICLQMTDPSRKTFIWKSKRA